MRRLLPRLLDDVDPYDLYADDPPSLRLNMVSAVDGAATDAGGTTATLGGPGDQAVFRALRALADGIVVGAGTVRAEGYGPHRPPAALAQRRAADGRPVPAPIVVVTRSGDLDWSGPLFTQAVTRTIVVTCATAGNLARARQVATVLVVGEETVDLPTAIADLHDEQGLTHLLCEGGPALASDLLRDGLVDELCLTLTPVLAGGAGAKTIVEGQRRRMDLSLTALAETAGELYCRYRVAR